MTLREKILLYLHLSGISADRMIQFMVEQYEQFRAPEGAGEINGVTASLDAASTQAVKLVEVTLRKSKHLVEDRMVALLQTVYTDAEFDQMNAFYQSPIGVKMSTIGGKVAMDLNEIGLSWNVEVMKEIELDIAMLLG